MARDGITRRSRDFGWGVVFFASYCLLAIFGLRWATVAGVASPVFPAAGVALAGLVLGGLRFWPAIFLGRLIAGWLEGSALPLWLELMIATGNTLAAVIGAQVLHWARTDPSLRRLRDVLTFVAAATGSAVLGAGFGVVALAYEMGHGALQAGIAWLNWSAGNLGGVLVVAPLIMVWARGGPISRERRWWLHLMLSVTAGAVTTWLLFGPQSSPMPRAFLVFAVILWAALACGIRGAVAVMVPVATISVWGTTKGYGAFAAASLQYQMEAMRFVVLQQFIGVASFSALVLAVTGDERRGKEALAKQAERLQKLSRELHETRDRLAATLAAAEVGTWTYDVLADRIVPDANMARMFSLPMNVVTEGMHLQPFSQAVHPEDRDRVAEASREALANKDYFEAEHRLLQADGSVRWVIARGRVQRDETGRAIGLPGVVVDITERKLAEQAVRESEERLALTLEAGQLGFWDWDLLSGYVHFGGRWAAMLGYELEEIEPNVRSWERLMHPDEIPRVMAVLNDHLEGRTEYYESEQRLRHKDGSWRWILDRGRVVKRDASGRALRAVGTHADITARKEAEREKQELLESERAARTEVERASRLKDEFLSTLSHELRTPLTAILGWLQILRRRVDIKDQDLAKALTVIERNARVQAQLIEDMLDMGRIISGKIHLDVQPVNLHDVVSAAMASVAPAAQAKGIRLETISGPTEGVVQGDPNRLQQVVWNLLSNAIKFTPKGGKVSVKLAQRESQLEMTVADTGQGIKPDFLPHAFDRFRQADGSTTRQYGGLGLGLSIVKQLVELHGGTVWAASPGEGKGATFTVQLPIIDYISIPQWGDKAEMMLPSGEYLHDNMELNGISVLFVDDTQDARDIVRNFLEERKARVSTAGSGAEALQILERERPDVLVSDIGMPEMDGYELIRRVRSLPEKRRDVPAVALTSFARADDRTRALRAGFQKHLAKPVQLTELMAAIKSLVRPTEAERKATGTD